MLNTEKNTRAMERRIRRAFKRWAQLECRRNPRPDLDFEHGQWWITEYPSLAQYSVIDAEGPGSVDGFDFEQVSTGYCS